MGFFTGFRSVGIHPGDDCVKKSCTRSDKLQPSLATTITIYFACRVIFAIKYIKYKVYKPLGA
jgi:hypothetical protein